LADHELLERFVQLRDETAFEAMVRRHGPTVFGVGRRILHDPEDAADVFQATFLVLARYAHRLGRRGSIGGWLYTVAYRLALKTKADNQRRRQPLPGAARATVVNPLDRLTARDLCGLLDEELQRLPESQRLPLLLCCVDGKARDEAARQLGWSLGQVKAGLERGRKTLVRRLERRGIAFSAGMLAASLSYCSTSVSVSPVLVAATTQAAMAFAAGQTAGSASAEVVSLASGMVKTILPSNFKLVLIASFTVGLLGLGAAGLRLLAHGHHALPPASDDKPAADREPQKLDQHGDPLPWSGLTRLGTTRLRHSDPVRNMAFQPGGKVLVTVGTDGTLAHWDVATGKELRRLVLSADRHDPVGGGSSAAGLTWGIGHAGGSVLSTVIAGDGTSLAVSGDGGFIRVLDAATAKQRCRIKLPREGIGDMVLSRDGARLAIVSGARILIWNATTGKLNGDLAESKDGKRDDGGPGRGSSSSLAFAPDGKTLARVEVKATPGKGGNGKPTNRAELTFIDAVTGQRVGPEIPAATVRFSWPSPVIYSQDGKLLAFDFLGPRPSSTPRTASSWRGGATASST
jgi:RNA polymerase sigma factor (sigma-70 family)